MQPREAASSAHSSYPDRPKGFHRSGIETSRDDSLRFLMTFENSVEEIKW
jgi:hypothetical protein